MPIFSAQTPSGYAAFSTLTPRNRAVARPDRGADQVLRVGRVRALRDCNSPVVELAAHRSLKDGQGHQRAEGAAVGDLEGGWVPASTRVCATSTAMMNVSALTRKRWESPTMYVAAIQPANATAA